MTNAALLRKKMKECALNQEEISQELGVTIHKFDKKMCCKEEFRASEIYKLVKLLGLDLELTTIIFFER